MYLLEVGLTIFDSAIASIPWLTRAAFDDDAENDFNQLSLYMWDCHFSWGLEAGALSLRVWWYMVAVNDNVITYYGLDRSIEAMFSRHMSEVTNGMLALPSGRLVEANVDVDKWRYSYYIEHTYVANLFALPAETFAAWRGWYMVHEDEIG